MSFRSITYDNDALDEFDVKLTLSKSGATCKILKYLSEPSKVLQKCYSSFRFIWNWANTVNLCAALKTESLFSLVSYLHTFTYLDHLEYFVVSNHCFLKDMSQSLRFKCCNLDLRLFVRNACKITIRHEACVSELRTFPIGLALLNHGIIRSPSACKRIPNLNRQYAYITLSYMTFNFQGRRFK